MKQYDSVAHAHERAFDYGKSKTVITVPNMALSIKDIFARFVRQQPIPNSLGEPIFTNNMEFDNLDRLQKADKAREIKSQIAVAKRKLDADARKDLEAKEAKRFADAVDAKVASQSLNANAAAKQS